MKKVRLSGDARAYIKFEARYLKDRNPIAANRFVAGLKKLQINLSQFPQMGFESEELPIPGVFRLTMGDYLVDYEVSGDLVEIRAIRHGRQRPPGVLFDDDFDFEKPDFLKPEE